MPLQEAKERKSHRHHPKTGLSCHEIWNLWDAGPRRAQASLAHSRWARNCSLIREVWTVSRWGICVNEICWNRIWIQLSFSPSLSRAPNEHLENCRDYFGARLLQSPCGLTSFSSLGVAVPLCSVVAGGGGCLLVSTRSPRGIWRMTLLCLVLLFLSLSLFFSRFTHKNGLCFGERSNWHRVESSMFYPIKVLVYLPAGNMSGL